LNPLTVAQNSLHGCFGSSGDISTVPPRAATIGPLEIVRSKRRVEIHALTTRGTFSSWQRTISKLSLFGPVTPLVPTSIIQRLGAEVIVSESLAAPVVPDFNDEY
jgi:glucosamine-6-phosphate deaminase